jgi:LysM repeat protein
MDMTSALSHGLEIRRGWDERHVPEAMTAAAIAQAQRAAEAFPDDPLRQVMAFIRGPQAARGLDAAALDAALLEWLHLFRVILQVDRNFDWNDTHALWMLRDGQIQELTCPEAGPVFFSLADTVPALYGALRMENPWFTTDSIGFNDQRPQLLIPIGAGLRWTNRSDFCSRRPAPMATTASVVHVVGPGDVLGGIARDYGVRIGEIKRFNQLEGDLIRVGQKLEIPGSLGRIAPAPTPAPSEYDTDAPWVWHTVREGESYWTISQQYPQAGLEAIMRMNDVSAEDLQPGMKLRIPPP